MLYRPLLTRSANLSLALLLFGAFPEAVAAQTTSVGREEIVFVVALEQLNSSAMSGLAAARTALRDVESRISPAADFAREDVVAVHRMQARGNVRGQLARDATLGRAKSLRELLLNAALGQEVQYLVGDRRQAPVIDEAGVPKLAGAVLSPPRDYGLRFRLIGLALPDGRLRVRVRAESSWPDYANTTLVDKLSVPSHRKRSTDKTIDVELGQSIAITGLANQSFVTGLSMIPDLETRYSLLASALSEKRRDSSSRLVVLITPLALEAR